MKKKRVPNSDFQRIKLTHAYDGFEFKGWQKQKSTSLTVQETLERALEKLFSFRIQVIAAGRTDAGVHALGQVAHFSLPKSSALVKDPMKLLKALNSLTPKFLVCLEALKVSDDFHALQSPSQKLYKYLIYNHLVPSPFMYRYSLLDPSKMDLDLLNRLSKPLLGKKDFKSFQNRGSPTKNTVREIYEARWERKKGGWFEFSILGSGFLKQMIRNIVGTQLSLMKKGLTENEMEELIEARDRKKGGQTISPYGLYLVAIKYLPC